MNYSAAIAFLDKASSRTVTLHISQQRMEKSLGKSESAQFLRLFLSGSL